MSFCFIKDHLEFIYWTCKKYSTCNFFLITIDWFGVPFLDVNPLGRQQLSKNFTFLYFVGFFFQVLSANYKNKINSGSL